MSILLAMLFSKSEIEPQRKEMNREGREAREGKNKNLRVLRALRVEK
jgi:hypothetical protein